jgi:hypothetical protein
MSKRNIQHPAKGPAQGNINKAAQPSQSRLPSFGQAQVQRYNDATVKAWDNPAPKKYNIPDPIIMDESGNDK